MHYKHHETKPSQIELIIIEQCTIEKWVSLSSPLPYSVSVML